jgi:hypothetical protein
VKNKNLHQETGGKQQRFSPIMPLMLWGKFPIENKIHVLGIPKQQEYH